jgi:hypothetical protein
VAVALAEVAAGVTRPRLLAALAPRLVALGARPSALDDAEREAFRRRQYLPAAVVGDGGAAAPGAAGGAAGPVPIGVDGDGALLLMWPDGSLDRRTIPA